VSSDTATDNQRSNHFFHDSTERPIQRPKDPQTQKACYSGKKKQRTIKNNLIINADSKVVLLTPSYEGSIHDKRIADTIGYCVPSGTVLYQDSGFQGFIPN
jgi:adenine-specific DNA methylase